MSDEYFMPQMSTNALALEYQRDYGSARRNLDVFDLVNNPCASGKCRVFGLSLTEKGSHSFFADIGVFRDNSTDSFLIAQRGLDIRFIEYRDAELAPNGEKHS